MNDSGSSRRKRIGVAIGVILLAVAVISAIRQAAELKQKMNAAEEPPPGA